MKAPFAVRSRASLRADLTIVLLGIWGFLRQCWRSVRWGRESAE